MYWTDADPLVSPGMYGQPPGFDGWGHAVLGRAILAYYAGSGDNRILASIGKAYHGLGARITLEDFEGRSSCNWETMLEAYSFGGEKYLYDSINTKGLLTLTQNWALNGKPVTHGVSWNELVKLPLLFYPWKGDTIYLAATKKSYQWLEDNHMQPYGVNSSDEILHGIGANIRTETCNISDYIWTHTYLMRFDGDRLYGDRVERAFFNAFPQCLSRDCRLHVYFQGPNRLYAPGNYIASSGVDAYDLYKKSYFPECCTGNLNRILPNYIIHSWMATYDNGLAAYLYGPCQVKALAGEHVPVTLTCNTNYPFSDTIVVSVNPQSSASFPLYFRVPGWCTQPVVSVNGQPISTSINDKGFIKVQRTWNTNDRVELRFPMTVRIKRGFQTDGAPYASVYYGPLLFALGIPEADLNNNSPAAGVEWQYALSCALSGADITVEHRPMLSVWSAWPFDAPLTLKTRATRFHWENNGRVANNGLVMPATSVPRGATQTISLIPYGCAKFRISMFPVTASPMPFIPASELTVTLLDSVTQQNVSTSAVVKLLRTGVVLDSDRSNNGKLILYGDSIGNYTINISAAGYLPKSGIPIVLSTNDTSLLIQCTRQTIIGIEIPDTVLMTFNSQTQLAQHVYCIYADGTRMLLYNTVVPNWTSRSPDMFSVNGSGLLSCNTEVGECYVVASLASHSDSSLVRVVQANTNFALLATATASSTQAGYNVNNVNDGIAITDFYSWASTSTPAWVQLDFAAPIAFNRVELFTTTDYELKEYTIQYWDGTSWVEIAVVTDNTQAHRSTSFSSVTCSRMRVYAPTGSAAQPNYARICELEIYNYTDDGVGLEEEGIQNEQLSLSVYPSPFNPTTRIRYEIPKTSARIELAIFDAAGRFVRCLPAACGSGSVMWNGEDNCGRKVSSGVYIVRLKAGNQIVQRRGLFVK